MVTRLRFLIKISLIIPILLLVVGFAPSIYAQITEVHIPDAFLDGSRCPPPPDGDIAICGRTRGIFKDTSSGKEKSGEGIEGVFIASYTSKVSGSIEGRSTFTWSNADGEYYINLHKNTGYNYLVFFCNSGGNLLVRDLYYVSTSIRGVKYLDIGLACNSQSADMSLLPPERVGLIDRNGFLTCGEERLDYDVNSTISSAAAAFTLRRIDLDNSYKDNSFNVWEVDAGEDVPATQVQLSRTTLEGRHKAERSSDPYGPFSFINSMIVGFNPSKVEKYGNETETYVSCDQLQDANHPVSDNGINSYVTGGLAVGLIPPFLWQDMLDLIDTDIIEDTPVCRLGDGSFRYLNQFEIGDEDYPYKTLFQLISDKNLQTELARSNFKYKGINDSGLNLPGGDEACRDDYFVTGTKAHEPFRACSETAHPGVSESLRLTGEFDDVYNPLYLMSTPFETIDSDSASITNPEGLFRVGLANTLCSCSTIEGGECVNPTPSLDLAHENTLISGYKVVTGTSPTGTFYREGLVGAITSAINTLLATFEVWAGNLIDAIYGGTECVLRDDSQFEYVTDCDLGEPFCEPEDYEVCVTSGGFACTIHQPPVCTCTTYTHYRKYDTFTYQGDNFCDGDVAFTLVTEAEVNNEPGDQLRASSDYVYRTFGSPFATLPYNVGSVDFADQSVTDATSNSHADAAQFVKQDGTVSAATYGDMVRFISQADPNNSANLINPRQYPFEPLPDFGECNGEIFAGISGMPDVNDLYSEAVFQFDANLPERYRTNPMDFPAYAYGEATTGVPCEILAGIHFMEGSAFQNRNLQNGGIISPTELAHSARRAGILFKTKVPDKDITAWDYRDYMQALSYYNGGGNMNCGVDPPTGWPGCPSQYIGDDDPYPSNWLDNRHTNMVLRYCRDHEVCLPYAPFTRPGAMAIALLVHRGITGN